MDALEEVTKEVNAVVYGRELPGDGIRNPCCGWHMQGG
jgi:hypothetical protein